MTRALNTTDFLPVFAQIEAIRREPVNVLAEATARPCRLHLTREQRARAVATIKTVLGIETPAGLRTPAEAAHKRRRLTLASLLKQAAKAGKSVKGAEVYPDRTVLQFGEPESADANNPWLADLDAAMK
jgi:hypothetical protein